MANVSKITFDVFTLELKLDAFGTPYRTVSLPSFYTFDKLHAMIIWLFQWSDEHQHRFKIPVNKEHINKPPLSQDFDDEDSSSSLIKSSDSNKNNAQNDTEHLKKHRTRRHKEDDCLFYWVSDLKSFPSASSSVNIKRKLESRVMLQNALQHKHDTLVYQYDFDSKINANWTVFITLLSTKSIRNFPISDFDPFEFVEIIDGGGKTIPEYQLNIDYDSAKTAGPATGNHSNTESAGYVSSPYASDYDREYEQEMREYNPKRLNEELGIMRKQFTMFYEDYKKNRKKKQKMRESQHDDDEKSKKKKHAHKEKQKNKKTQKEKQSKNGKNKKKKQEKSEAKEQYDREHDDDEKVVDIVHDTTDHEEYDSKDDSEYIDATTDATINTDSEEDDSSSSSSSTSPSDYDEDEFLSTTESEIYHKKDSRFTEINDYDQILMYRNKKRTKQNRQRTQYCCAALILFFCILAWILARSTLNP
eukprot:CAMPEP_0197076176 /NCGR_PEP_ID=MMETSP1384-20130603/211979_1 /TAXON_ID=29189 /ORGANISM="Ammonia sp." /LENGTH=473 /DNA_ID=CAMNT_0042515025 /DNA_START=1179 /DNA_END=2600 /DNA_ORIENTATION=+